MAFANKIACIFLLFSFISVAQTHEIDSLFRYSKFEDIKALLSDNSSISENNLKLAKSKYFNTFKQLEESFVSLYAIDTTTLSSKQKAHYYLNLAEAYDHNSNFDLAAENYLKAQKLFFDTNDLVKYNDINYSLSLLLTNLDIYKEPEYYFDEYKKMAKQLNDYQQLAKVEIDLTFRSIDDGDSTSVFLDHIQKAYNYLEKDFNYQYLGVIHTYHAFYYTDVLIQKDSAIHYYNKAIKIYEDLGLKQKVALNYFSLGDLSSFEGEYEEAIKWYKKANDKRNFSYDYELTSFIYKYMAEDYKELNQMDSAYYYLVKSFQFRDSLNYQKQNISLTRFEAQKKEKQNLILQKKNQRNEAFIFGSLGALVLLTFLSFSVYINAKRKRLLIEKDKALEIKQIEGQLKKQQLKALDALVIGQEKERMRIASDLHDNIGSNFMAIKAYFDHFKKDFNSHSTASPIFDKTQGLLEETYQDIRSLAHFKHSGLMRDSGLIPALSKLSKNVSMFSKIEVDFDSFIEEDLKLNDTLELNVFRVIQETMANIVKHSQAKKASISLNKIDTLLNIIVEDDGIGFDEHQINAQDSFGLQSIKERIQLLNGKFTIDTKKGRGTTIIIDIPL